MARELHTLVDVHKHQFSLIDPEREEFELWTNAWDIVHVGVSTQTLTVFTSRADGRVPLMVRVLSEEPTVEADRWSGVVEGAHLHCPSGSLAIDELTGSLSDAPRLAIPPVPHRALVCFGDVDSSGYDGRDGADHYLVLLWPGEPETPRARKKYRYVDRPRLEPRLPIEDARALAESAEPHDRFHGLVELARHGGAQALTRLLATEGEVARHHACCALGLVHPLPMDALEAFATDASPRVRAAAISVLHDALFAVDSGEREPLDPDRCYGIVQLGLNDSHPEPLAAAEAAICELDAMADYLRAATLAEGAPGQTSDLERAARAYLGRLIERSLLETEPGFDPQRATEAVIGAMGAMEYGRSGLGAALADALIEVDGVVDVFATDEELEAALRE